MALSYAAYNPIRYQALPFVPSGFMQDPYDDETRTAESELTSMGFDATSFNYNDGYCGYAAHTIGHKEITISKNNVDTEGDNNDINGNVAAVVNTGSGVSSNLSVVEADTGETLRNAIQSGEITSETDETISEATNNSRTLIVISIRGSVTLLDGAIRNQGTVL